MRSASRLLSGLAAAAFVVAPLAPVAAHTTEDDGPVIIGEGVVTGGCTGHVVEFQGTHLGGNQWRFVFDRLTDDGQCTPVDGGTAQGPWNPPHGNSGPSGRICLFPAQPAGFFCLAWVKDSIFPNEPTHSVSFSINGIGGSSEGWADVVRLG